ncbi:hypothetical protein B0H17DRAFT_27157 [Mycena rosella]|uniref:DUF6699 domain-containing protein n=1 Tax=Mycena rosella TaxID=1033263 RepID=A0AAD7D8E7_MYCRO|nr:hypothetical protein B0H17DRAFT_27157 [Mycena rosella]
MLLLPQIYKGARISGSPAARLHTMGSKHLRFNPTVDEYAERHTMTPKQLRFDSTVDEYEERDTADPPSPASGLVIDRSLRPRECSPFDFSLPSPFFTADPRLDADLRDTPACSPPLKQVIVRISSHTKYGPCKFPVNPDPERPQVPVVTVGDVITEIQWQLRQVLASSDSGVRWYRQRRAQTVENYAQNVDQRTKEQARDQELRAETRVVDHLLGKVLFAGLEMRSSAEPHVWSLKLDSSPRYSTKV